MGKGPPVVIVNYPNGKLNKVLIENEVFYKKSSNGSSH